MGNAAVSRPLEKGLLRLRHSVTLLDEAKLRSPQPGTGSPIPSPISVQRAALRDGCWGGIR
jgi:hypothetical protein